MPATLWSLILNILSGLPHKIMWTWWKQDQYSSYQLDNYMCKDVFHKWTQSLQWPYKLGIINYYY
jgi:hypothetical protein